MIIKSNVLAAALKQLKSVTPPTSMMKTPGILISNGRAVSTNGELTVCVKLDISEDERFVIPMQAVHMIDTLPPNEIELKQAGGRIKITAKGIQSVFNTVDPDDYPPMPDEWKGIDKENVAVLSGDDFAVTVSGVMHATGKEDIKPVLNCIHLETEDNVLNAVACDGFRIAWNCMPALANICVNIPKKAISTMLSLGTAGELKIANGKSNVAVFEFENHTVITQIVNGTFISYNSLFKTDNTKHVVVNRESALRSISRSVMISDGIPKVNVKGNDEQKIFNISANCTFAEFDEDIAYESGDFNSEVKFSVNPKYLVDALKAVSTSEAVLQCSGELSPILITGGTLKQLIQPMRA